MPQGGHTSWEGHWWDLPPLILHPFGRTVEAAAVLESIKVSLELSGAGEAEAKERLLHTRYREFRMLTLAGKDVMRWVAQCVDFAGRDAVLAERGIRAQSFTDFLVNRTPATVAERFVNWGVADYRRILSRAIGLNAVFPFPPEFHVISTSFLEDYYSYVDSLYQCYQGLTPFTPLDSRAFGFALYTSDEYMTALGCGPEDEPA